MPTLSDTTSSSDEDSLSEKELQLNISDDKYYKPLTKAPATKPNPPVDTDVDRLDIPNYGSNTIQHSLPAYDLWKPFFPTYLSEEKILSFHRPKLRHYNNGPQARQLSRKTIKSGHPVKNLSRLIYRCQKKLRFQIITAINEGKSRNEIYNRYLLIRKCKDLTAKHGELFFFEYSEEHPPVLSQIGMSSNVKVYSKPDQLTAYSKLKAAHDNNQSVTAKSLPSETTPNDDVGGGGGGDTNKPDAVKLGNYNIGMKQVVKDEGIRPNSNKMSQIYYSQLKKGSSCLFIENNLYRAPVFEQEPAGTDFLVIRTRNSFYIRLFTNTYTVGQIMPLVAIPEPKANSITKFRSHLSNVYIHKLFKESTSDPPTLDLDIIAKFFPDYNRAILRERMKHQGVKFLTGKDRGYCLRGTSKYGLKPLKELRSYFSPEQYCLNMAMLAARERLRDLNYTDSMITPPDEKAEKEIEVLAAPWNTSKAVLSALKGSIYLDFRKHLIDPTGQQREGFSCVSWVKSPTEEEQLKERAAYRLGERPSSKPSPVCMTNPQAQKIKREKLERLAIYQREAQHISEVQSASLSSRAALSSGESEEEDEDEENSLDKSFDQQLNMLDKLVIEGQSMQEFNYQKEEEERHQMLKEFCPNGQVVDETRKEAMEVDETGEQQPMSQQKQPINVASFKNKILRIIRTYDTPEGKIQRTEIVRDPKIIALYIKQKGGTLNSSQELDISKDNLTQQQQQNHLHKTMGNFSSQNRHSISQRRSSVSLGPTELCRADGMVLTISKKVLDTRAMRQARREAMVVD